MLCDKNGDIKCVQENRGFSVSISEQYQNYHFYDIGAILSTEIEKVGGLISSKFYGIGKVGKINFGPDLLDLDTDNIPDYPEVATMTIEDSRNRKKYSQKFSKIQNLSDKIRVPASDKLFDFSIPFWSGS